MDFMIAMLPLLGWLCMGIALGGIALIALRLIPSPGVKVFAGLATLLVTTVIMRAVGNDNYETSAYGTFADGGVHVPYYAIDKVVIASTQQTYAHPKNTGNKVVSPQLAYMMTNVLSDNTSRLPEFYDCNVLQLYSNSQADCWYGNRGTEIGRAHV